VIVDPKNVAISAKAREFLDKKIPEMFKGKPLESEPGKKFATLTHTLQTTRNDENGNEVVLYGPRWIRGANFMRDLDGHVFVEVSKDKFLAIGIYPIFRRTTNYLLELVDNDEIVVVESGGP
jgi:hypothetical protein